MEEKELNTIPWASEIAAVPALVQLVGLDEHDSGPPGLHGAVQLLRDDGCYELLLWWAHDRHQSPVAQQKPGGDKTYIRKFKACAFFPKCV